MSDFQVSPAYVLGSISLGLVVPTVLGFFTMFYRFPEQLVRLGFRYQMFRSGMKQRFVRDGKKYFCYGEKNSPRPDQPSVVFIHGFTSSKLQWLAAFKCLRTNSHMVAVDMPGHGDSYTPEECETIDIDFIDRNVSHFLELVGLGDKKIHLVGTSLGGAIVGVYSALHPQKVASVTMVCPVMHSPTETEFLIDLKKSMEKDDSLITYDDCIFFPQDIEGMKKMFDLCMFHKESIETIRPVVFQGMLNIRSRKYPYFLRMFKATNTEEYLNKLVEIAPSITMPSQVLWGKHDEILHCSGAEYLGSKLPNCKRVELFDNCGHTVDFDRPGSLCKALEKIIKNE